MSNRDQFRQWLEENTLPTRDQAADAAASIFEAPGEAYIHPWGYSYCVHRVIASKSDQYLSRDGLWIPERTCFHERAEAEAALAKFKEQQ